MNDISTQLRQAIMVNVKANGLPVTGDFWFFLVFRTESELKEIAREMNIRVDNLK